VPAQHGHVADAAARRARSVRFWRLETARQLSRSIGSARLMPRPLAAGHQSQVHFRGRSDHFQWYRSSPDITDIPYTFNLL